MTPLTPQLPVTAHARGPKGSNRLLAAGPHASLADHEQTYGPLPARDLNENFIRELEASGLTGRGGAAFASWRKISATARRRGGFMRQGKSVVIGNGAEGEPLSFKDKALLFHAPHLVLDGLIVAARSVSASMLYLYTTPAAAEEIKTAISERHDARRIQVVEAPDTFISGQASAVVNAIGGGKALPFDSRRRLSESGLRGRPTLVFNVETLAHIGLIARYGAGWFRSSGSERDPGTRLISVSGWGAEQVLEIEGDAGLRTVLASAGVDFHAAQAVLVGGYHGRWVKPLDYQLSPSGSASRTVRPGAGVLHVLSTQRCGLKETSRIVDYLAAESAKQCGPCMFGMPAMAKLLSTIAHGEGGPNLVGELERLGKLVGGRGACHHPDGTLQLIGSALEVFADDISAHSAGGCTQLAGRTS